MLFSILYLQLCLPAIALAEMKVLALPSLMTNLAKEEGEKDMGVVQLIDAHDIPHTFNPTPLGLAKIKGVATLRETPRDFIQMVEVGNAVPSLRVLDKEPLHICNPSDSMGAAKETCIKISGIPLADGVEQGYEIVMRATVGSVANALGE